VSAQPARRARAWLLGLIGAFGLLSCSEPARDWPQPEPALWEISRAGEPSGWLFGTIHALPGDVRWRTAPIERALASAGVLVVEVGELADADAGRRAFAEVSSSPALPPLLQRLPAGQRPALAAALERAGMAERDFATSETWAAALLLANAAGSLESENGVDRALLAEGLPVIALEDFAQQFALFDSLAEADQAVLLHEAARTITQQRELTLAEAWLTGDLQTLEREGRKGLLADPELREALLTSRNQAWTRTIAALLEQGERPLVAVGAAHMIGNDGLPALLEQHGYQVTRIQ
jgi:uncharacterized protein YbaP (TraB family)